MDKQKCESCGSEDTATVHLKAILDLINKNPDVNINLHGNSINQLVKQADYTGKEKITACKHCQWYKFE